MCSDRRLAINPSTIFLTSLPVYSDVESRNHMQHCGPVNPLPIDGLAIGGYSELDNFDISAQPSYPSPPSTISAGGSPSHLTANHSSALAFALDGQHHEQVRYFFFSS